MNGLFGGGTGISEDPYLVEDGFDLQTISSQTEKYYRQIKDIDLSGFANWIPVNGSGGAFIGRYDGGNFEIANCHCNQSEFGLFLYVEAGLTHPGGGMANGFGIIENLKLKNFVMRGSIGGCLASSIRRTNSSGLQGSNYSPLISNIHISNSEIIATRVVDSPTYVGGLTGETKWIGGVWSGGDGFIKRSGFSGSIDVEHISASPYSFFIGGLIGRVWAGIYLWDCRSIAVITDSSPDYGFYGGLIGNMSGQGVAVDFYSSKIKQNYAIGSITKAVSGSYVAGFSGHTDLRNYADYGVSVLEKNFVGITINGSNNNYGFSFVSSLTYIPVAVNCYYDLETTGCSDTTIGSSPKTTFEMKHIGTYTTDGWGITEDTPYVTNLIYGGYEGTPFPFGIEDDINDGYPYLWWELVSSFLSSVKVDGVFKKINAVFTKVGNVWKNVSEGKVKVGGVWEKF